MTGAGATSLRWSGTHAPASPKGDPLLDYAILPARALLILVVAWVANRLVRRAIGRMVASMSEDRGLAALRPPSALARTGEIPSLRVGSKVLVPRWWLDQALACTTQPEAAEG